MGLITWIKDKFYKFAIEHISFPNKCVTGNEMDWMLKNNCPCCILQPIEPLSNKEYHEKYPANNRMRIGAVTIYLCDKHFEQLKSELLKDEHI